MLAVMKTKRTLFCVFVALSVSLPVLTGYLSQSYNKCVITCQACPLVCVELVASLVVSWHNLASLTSNPVTTNRFMMLLSLVS